MKDKKGRRQISPAKDIVVIVRKFYLFSLNLSKPVFYSHCYCSYAPVYTIVKKVNY